MENFQEHYNKLLREKVLMPFIKNVISELTSNKRFMILGDVEVISSNRFHFICLIDYCLVSVYFKEHECSQMSICLAKEIDFSDLEGIVTIQGYETYTKDEFFETFDELKSRFTAKKFSQIEHYPKLIKNLLNRIELSNTPGFKEMGFLE